MAVLPAAASRTIQCTLLSDCYQTAHLFSFDDALVFVPVLGSFPDRELISL